MSADFDRAANAVFHVRNCCERILSVDLDAAANGDADPTEIADLALDAIVLLKEARALLLLRHASAAALPSAA
jgi:hypothetical protein